METHPNVTLECREFAGSLWSESTATWNGIGGNNYGMIYSSCSAWTTGYYYHFDITSLAQRWYSGASDWRKGIVLRGNDSWEASSTMIEKPLASVQYATTAYRPRFEFTYAENRVEDGVYFIKNLNNNKVLSMTRIPAASAEAPVLYQTDLNDILMDQGGYYYNQLWRVHNCGDGSYTLRPLDNTRRGLAQLDLHLMGVEIGLSDSSSDIFPYARWNISESFAASYSVRSNKEPYYLTSVLEDESRVDLKTDSSGTETTWTFLRITDFQEGIFVHDSSGMEVSNVGYTVYAGNNYLMSDWNYTYSLATAGDLYEPYFASIQNTSIANLLRFTSSIYLWGYERGTTMLQVEIWSSTYGGYRALQVPVTVKTYEGTYYLRNWGTGKFADIDGPTMANNQTIHQWDFHGYGSQKWIIEHHGNGYYSFRTAYTATPYYLSWSGDSNSGADHPIVLYNFSSINDVVLWRIFSDPDGLLHFIPKNCEEMMYCLAVETNSTDNGIRLMQHPLYSGKDIEKWILLTKPYELKINIYYDLAFRERYGNGNSAQPENLLIHFFDYVNQYSSALFGLKFRLNQPILYQSTADMCKISRGYSISNSTVDLICPNNPSSNSTENCQYGRDCTSNDIMYKDFIAKHSGKATELSIFFTGSKLYKENGDIGNRSFSWYNYGILIQELYPDINGTNDLDMCGVLLHEISHQLSVKDHYHEMKKDPLTGIESCVGEDRCDDCEGNQNPRPGWCIMDSCSFNDEQNGFEVYCVACKNEIFQYLISLFL